MIEKIFLAVNWKRIYALALWCMGLGGAFLIFFWLWHWRYTGEIATGTWNLPRIFDAVGLIVWVATTVTMLRMIAWFAMVDFHPTRGWPFNFLARFGIVSVSMLYVVWFVMSVVQSYLYDIFSIVPGVPFSLAAFCIYFLFILGLKKCYDFLWGHRSSYFR